MLRAHVNRPGLDRTPRSLDRNPRENFTRRVGPFGDPRECDEGCPQEREKHQNGYLPKVARMVCRSLAFFQMVLQGILTFHHITCPIIETSPFRSLSETLLKNQKHGGIRVHLWLGGAQIPYSNSSGFCVSHQPTAPNEQSRNCCIFLYIFCGHPFLAEKPTSHPATKTRLPHEHVRTRLVSSRPRQYQTLKITPPKKNTPA